MTHKGPDLQGARLLSKDDAGGGLARLALEAPDSLVATYTCPGQYVSLGAGAKPVYLVLAADPGQRTWEFLVRPGGEAVTTVLAVEPGGTLYVSPALGAGFPVEEAKGQELILAVTGSGLAAARPVVRARIAAGEAGTTELLLGVRTVADVPLEGELRAWADSGVRVVVCLSREGAAPGAAYATGYVQDVARRDTRAAPKTRRLIFAAGVKPMIDAMRALARDLGVHESDVRTNY